jgi:DNA-3-methyladenine glycosylase II
MDYREQLAKDKKLAKVLKGQETVELKFRKNICLRLCASIMSQQLSTKVAKVLYHRFLDLYFGHEPTPAEIADTPYDTLKAIGLSGAKTQYILNVAQFAVAHKLTDAKIRKMSDKDVIELLTQIKGVGNWTVEMLLMFTLGREDVFAVDDYGIQTAMKKIYGLDTTNKKALKEEMLRISAKWSPYRTYACLHLWQWKDEPVVK